MHTYTKYAAILGLFLAWFGSGCHNSGAEVSVPSDCRQFLDKFFEAVKSKDVGKLQELASYVSLAQSAGVPAGPLDRMRETKKQFAKDTFERMNKDFGDLRSCSVVSVKTTTITTADLAAKNMQGTMQEGIHTEVVCRAKFTRQNSALIRLNLFKETPESEYFIEGWMYQAEL